MSDDRAAAMAAHAALCATRGVRDLYEGDCRGCGECCSRFVPVSVFDLRRPNEKLGIRVERFD